MWANPPAGEQLALHVGETTISFPFKPQQARAITASISGLLETFAAKQKAERPKRWDMMEYKYTGALKPIQASRPRGGHVLSMKLSLKYRASARISPGLPTG